MRIIGGFKKGFKILGPPQVKILSLKPMPEKVREAIFDILGKWVEGKDVLDLYAGTGALGLEALSRGAKEVIFVEIVPKTAFLIKDNLRKLNFSARVSIKDAQKFLETTNKRFDIIFITPPHQKINFRAVNLAKKKLKKDGLIILESSSKEEIPEIYGLKIIDQRIYRKIKITFFEKMG